MKSNSFDLLITGAASLGQISERRKMIYPSVLTLGEVLFDCIEIQLSSQNHEVSYECYAGGAPANVACALENLGTPSGFIGSVGKDSSGQKIVEILKRLGVDVTGVQHHNSAPTRKIFVLLSESGERNFIRFSNSNISEFADTYLDSQQIPIDLFKHANFLVLGTLQLAFPQSQEAISYAIQLAHQYKVKIFLDVNLRRRFWQDLTNARNLIREQLARQVDFIKLSEDEAEWLFDTTSPIDIIRQLNHLNGVLVTFGSRGCVYCLGEDRHQDQVSSFYVSTKDTTGAGDGFTAGIIHQLCQVGVENLANPETAKSIVRYASAVAALTITRPGAINALPTSKEVENFLKQLRNGIQAGYSPQLQQGDPIWDPILLKDQAGYRIFFLTASKEANPFWSLGEIGTAKSNNLEHWDYSGIILKPDPDRHWKCGRILSGSVYNENGIYYFFYSAAPRGTSLLHEGIGLTISKDGENWIHCQDKLIEPNENFYGSQGRDFQGERLQHRPWRDPFVIKDPNTEKYYIFITASSVRGQHFKGCVGLAVSEYIEGPYKVLPPAAHPLIEGTEESIFHHMERPQVIYRHGKYYLFFSAWKHSINPKWLQNLCQDRITNSSLYCYVSKEITGPFEPIEEIPVVYGSEKTGLYGTNFIQAPSKGLMAYGWYYQSFSLEVSPRFPVHWENNFIKIFA